MTRMSVLEAWTWINEYGSAIGAVVAIPVRKVPIAGTSFYAFLFLFKKVEPWLLKELPVS